MPFLFLRKQEILDLHSRLIEEFGGLRGLRDEAALESALNAPENLEHYEVADLATCAAAYAYHLSQAHAFVDGNKRAAAAASEIFIELNGSRLTATNEQIVRVFVEIAAGALSRQDVARFFQEWIAFT